MEDKIEFQFNKRFFDDAQKGYAVGPDGQTPDLSSPSTTVIGTDYRELIHAIVFNPNNDIVFNATADDQILYLYQTRNLRNKNFYMKSDGFTGQKLASAINRINLSRTNTLIYDQVRHNTHELGETLIFSKSDSDFFYIFTFGVNIDGSYANPMDTTEVFTSIQAAPDSQPPIGQAYYQQINTGTGVTDQIDEFYYGTDLSWQLVIDRPVVGDWFHVVHCGKSDGSEDLIYTVINNPVPLHQTLHRLNVTTLAETILGPVDIDVSSNGGKTNDIAPGRLITFEISDSTPQLRTQRISGVDINNGNQWFNQRQALYSPQYYASTVEAYDTLWLAGQDQLFMNADDGLVWTYQAIIDIIEQTFKNYVIGDQWQGGFMPAPKTMKVDPFSSTTAEVECGLYNGHRFNTQNPQFTDSGSFKAAHQEPLSPLYSVPVFDSLNKGLFEQTLPDIKSLYQVIAAEGEGYLSNINYKADKFYGYSHMLANGRVQNVVYDSELDGDSTVLRNAVFAANCDLSKSTIKSTLLNGNYLILGCVSDKIWLRDSALGIGNGFYQPAPVTIISNSILTDVIKPSGESNLFYACTVHKCGSFGVYRNGITSGIFSEWIQEPPVNFLTSTQGDEVYLAGNPIYYSADEPYNLRLQSEQKGDPVTSPAFGMSLLTSQWGGQRELGAYDDQQSPSTVYERIQIEAPWECQVKTDAKEKKNTLDDGANPIGRLTELYLIFNFQWKLTIDEKEREKIYKMLRARRTEVIYFPYPLTKPDKFLTGHIQPKSDLSNVKAQINGYANKITMKVYFSKPDDSEIDDYI